MVLMGLRIPGCPFGQAVNATGDCSDTCPDGFMMEDNTCGTYLDLVSPSVD
jgi:hypothetical protein